MSHCDKFLMHIPSPVKKCSIWSEWYDKEDCGSMKSEEEREKST